MGVGLTRVCNFFLGNAVRAASPATTLKGLAKIAKRKPGVYDDAIKRNLYERLAAEKLTFRGFARLPGKLVLPVIIEPIRELPKERVAVMLSEFPWSRRTHTMTESIRDEVSEMAGGETEEKICVTDVQYVGFSSLSRVLAALGRDYLEQCFPILRGGEECIYRYHRYVRHKGFLCYGDRTVAEPHYRKITAGMMAEEIRGFCWRTTPS